MKHQLPSRAKKTLVDGAISNEVIIEKAHEWAALHANKKTRDKMDEVIAGLDERTARKIVLCGQRISGGLEPKVVK